MSTQSTSGVERQLAAFERFTAGAGASAPAWLQARRKQALGRFAELGFPTTRLEDWRYTNVAPIAKLALEADEVPREVSAAEVDSLAFDGLAGPRVVTLNGRLAPALSSLPRTSGVRVESLVGALARRPDLAAQLGRVAGFESRAFVALNTAFLADGVLVDVQAGADVQAPIYLLHLSLPGTGPLLSQPRTLIRAERSSRVTVFEDFVSLGGGPRLTNAVTEVWAAENATVEHVRIQREDLTAFHVGVLAAHQARDSRFASRAFSLGAALCRSEIGSLLDGEGAECVLDGLYVATDGQHVDCQTHIDHARPHGSSSELYKGILGGGARGVFNGRIVVRPDAQKTDAHQQNKNLLLADGAEMDTKPQLEIHADDVKCSHGSTIGRLDEDALFYLRARGIGEPAARGLLTRGFAAEIVAGVGAEPVRQRLEALLLERIHLARAVEEAA